MVGLTTRVSAVMLGVFCAAAQAGEKIQFSGKGDRPLSNQERRMLPGVDVRNTVGGQRAGIDGVSMPAPPSKDEPDLTRYQKQVLDERRNWMFQTTEKTNRIALPEEKELEEREENAKELGLNDRKPQGAVERFLEERTKAAQSKATNNLNKAEAQQKELPDHAAKPGDEDARPGNTMPTGRNLADLAPKESRIRMFESSRIGSLADRDTGSRVATLGDPKGSETRPGGILDFLGSRPVNAPRQSSLTGGAFSSGNSGPPSQPATASRNLGDSLGGRNPAFGNAPSAPALMTPLPGATGFNPEPEKPREHRPTVFQIPKRKF
ncbi:MAG: hypothetical protein AB1705_13440 [Verrucomicrobiota bacterium]